MTEGPGTIHEALRLTRRGDGVFTACSARSAERLVVFGGQQIGQVVVAAALTDPSKTVRQVHTDFVRAGTIERGVEIAVRTAHAGRTLTTLGVTVSQGDRLLSESLVTLDAADPTTLSADPVAPGHDAPVDPGGSGGAGPHVVMVGAPDLEASASGGAAELDVWTRWPEAVDASDAVGQALLAWNTVPYLISAAMRPHAGYGIGMAHRQISTGVLTHTITFHRPPAPTDWQLVVNRSVHAGHGRSYGSGDVFDPGGRLLASFTQVNMIRALTAEPGAPASTM